MNESTPATAAPDDRPCSDQMRANGLQPPRTCPTGKLGPCKFSQPSPSTGGELATDSAGRDDLLGKSWLKWLEENGQCPVRAYCAKIAALESALRAAREPAPVSRELDVEAERREDQAEALADLRQAVKDEVSDEWLLAFIQQYPFAARQATAESAPTSAAPGEWISVTDRLPADGQQVIVCHKTVYSNAPSVQSVSCAMFRHGDWHANGHGLYTPTHWQPMPAAPSNNSPVGAKESK